MLLAMLQFVSPSDAGPLGVLFVFLCLYVTAVGVVSFILYGAGKLLPRASRLFMLRRPIAQLSMKKAYYFACVVGLGVVMAVAVQSVGSLDAYSAVLIAIFVAIGCAYVARQMR